MALHVTCVCGKTLAVADSAAGSTIACPACQGSVSVPNPGALPDLDDIGVEAEGVHEVHNIEEVNEEEDDPKTGYGVEVDISNRAGVLTGDLGTIRLRREHGPARCLAFSPDGGMALAATQNVVQVLDVRAQKRFQGVFNHRAPVTCLCFAPDGQCVLLGDDEGRLLLWEMATGAPRRWFDGHREAVVCVAFAPNGELMASGGADGRVRLWDVSSGAELGLVKASWREDVTVVAFTHDSRAILAGGAEGKTRVWNAQTGEVVQRLVGPKEAGSVVFTADGAVAAGRHELDICHWKWKTGERKRYFSDSTYLKEYVTRTLIVPGARRLLVVRKHLEHLKSHQEPGVNPGEILLVGLAGSAVGAFARNTLAGAHDAANSKRRFFLDVFELTTERTAQSFDCGTSQPVSLAASPDGRRALAGFSDGTVRVYGL